MTNDYFFKQQRLYNDTKREALIALYESLVSLKLTMITSGIYLEGATKTKFEELLTQLKADMFDANIPKRNKA